MHRRLIVLIAVLILIFNALPVFAQQARGVDVVIILDTSGPMLDSFDKFCVSFPANVVALQQHGFDLQVTILGITKPYSCAKDTVRAIPGSTVASDNDWGAAVADVAATHPWRSNAVRLIVPLSNRGPALGDPVDDPGPDRDTIERAIRAAQANRVVVLPVLGAPDRTTQPADRAKLEKLAADLAQATGGQVALLKSIAIDPTKDIFTVIGAVTQTSGDNTPILSIPGSIYTLTCYRDVSKCLSRDPGVWITDGIVTLLVVVIAGTSTALFSASLARTQLPSVKVNDRVKTAVSTGAQKAQRGWRAAFAPGSWAIGTPLLRWTLATALILLFVGFSALLTAFIDPQFNAATGQGLAIFATLFVAIGLTTWLAAWTEVRTLRASSLGAALRVRPLVLLLTILAVIVSRAINFLPGFIAALFLSESLYNTPEDIAGPRQRAALSSLLSMVILIAIAWLLAVPVDWLLGNLLAQTNNATAQLAAGAVGLIESLILTVYIVALEHAFYRLFSSRFMPGSRLFDFKRLVWGAGFALITFMLFLTAINPTLSGVEVFRLPAVLVIGLLLLTASAVALGAWLRVNDKQWQGDRPSHRLLFSAITLLAMWLVVGGCGVVYLITRIGK